MVLVLVTWFASVSGTASLFFLSKFWLVYGKAHNCVESVGVVLCSQTTPGEGLVDCLQSIDRETAI